MDNILCTICARGGSKGVKNKNIKHISGKPLIAYTIEQAKNSGLFESTLTSYRANEGMKRGDVSDIIYRLLALKELGVNKYQKSLDEQM